MPQGMSNFESGQKLRSFIGSIFLEDLPGEEAGSAIGPLVEQFELRKP